MKVLKRILITIGAIIGVLALGVAALVGFVAYRGAHYYDFVETGGPIEAQYTPMGPHDVEHESFEGGTFRQDVWYPADLDESYPLVVIANGTGVPATSVEPALRHLASWGFIVVGNDDENSRSGASSAESRDFMIALNDDPESVFHGRIDTGRIGISGHSQGGVGAVNAVTEQPGGNLFTAVFLASPTSEYWGQESVFGTDWSYGPEKLTAPVFLMAGTGSFDAGTATGITAGEGQGIAPLWSLQSTFDRVPEGVAKVLSRRVDSDHGDTFNNASGYMVAWFQYWLKDDAAAGEAFFGAAPELADNPHWQDTAVGH